MKPEPKKDLDPVAGQLTYFNILAQSIQAINQAIMQEKDCRDAAENLLSDLPEDWTEEIKDRIEAITKGYNEVVLLQNTFFIKGIPEHQKADARKKINIAEKKYARSIKNVVITLMKSKGLLYQTKREIEHGAISLYELMGKQEPEEDD